MLKSRSLSPFSPQLNTKKKAKDILRLRSLDPFAFEDSSWLCGHPYPLWNPSPLPPPLLTHCAQRTHISA